ncbi:nitrate/nitrite transporter NrtS [Roseivivax jejudonensis]|nr:nitrate/nitrite transporter NrtS [Roseivivax jejudonensis]
MALIVGHVIAVINHGDAIWHGTMDAPQWAKVAVTFLVPYTVSTVSSVLAVLERNVPRDTMGDMDANAKTHPTRLGL